MFQDSRRYYTNVQSGVPGVKEINYFQKQEENTGKNPASSIKMASKLNIHPINSFQKQKENMGKETCVIHQNDLQTKHSSTASDINKPALIIEK